MRMFPAETKENGFTIFELVVVLAIISVMVSITPGLYRAVVEGYEMRQAANDIAVAGRLLRLTAMESGETTQLAINTEENLLSGTEISLQIPSGVILNFRPEQSLATTNGNSISFYVNGASSGGVIELEKDDFLISVHFDWVTGSVVVRS